MSYEEGFGVDFHRGVPSLFCGCIKSRKRDFKRAKLKIWQSQTSEGIFHSLLSSRESLQNFVIALKRTSVPRLGKQSRFSSDFEQDQ